jgi:hypothetical protein
LKTDLPRSAAVFKNWGIFGDKFFPGPIRSARCLVSINIFYRACMCKGRQRRNTTSTKVWFLAGPRDTESGWCNRAPSLLDSVIRYTVFHLFQLSHPQVRGLGLPLSRWVVSRVGMPSASWVVDDLQKGVQVWFQAHSVRTQYTRDRSHPQFCAAPSLLGS